MSSRTTMKVNAPRKVVKEWRRKFPLIRDSDIIKVMWDSSLVRVEAALRNGKIPRPETILKNDKTKKKQKRKIVF